MEVSTEDNSDVTKKVTILEAVNMAQHAWDKVSPDHIVKCFKHGGITRSGEQAENEENEWDTTGSLLVDVVGVPSNLSEEEFTAMVDMDEELSVMGDLTNQDLLSISQEEEEDTEEEEDEPKPPLTSKDLMAGLAVVRRFALEAGMGESIKDVEKAILESVRAKKKQKSSTDFEKPI